MKTGDLVISSDNALSLSSEPGIVLEVEINMWHEEVEPTGVAVMWSTGEIETLYEDEIEKLRNIAVE
jgi:hypothetical protein